MEAFRRLMAARARLDRNPVTTAAADRTAAEQTGAAERPLVSLFEPGQPNPASLASPIPGGEPQLEIARSPQRRRPVWLLALALTLAVGLGAGLVLGSTWAGNNRSSAPAPPTPMSQPALAPATSIVVRPAATPACLETAKRGDQLVALLIQNKRSRAAKLLIPYHVASRQCAKDAAP